MGFFDKFKDMNNATYLDQPLNQPFTPEAISALGPGDIFVFGSNLAGQHHGGAARAAVTRFGAVMGQGEGLQGRSYAIPTMQGGVDTIKPYVDRFIAFAKEHRELTFYVTKIGCGIAGFRVEEIAPLFMDAPDVENIRLPKEFVDIIRQIKLIHQDILTHAYGVTRTFADVVITLNKHTPFRSAEEALTALNQYFDSLMRYGDDTAFTAVRIFWGVLGDPKVFADGKLNVDLFREKIFNYNNFVGEYHGAYLMHCEEKICNVVATLNEFRRYTDPEEVLKDISKCRLTAVNHCGPNDEHYLLSPVHAGNGYPMFFFTQFFHDNWSKIAPHGTLDPRLLNEYMFNRHARGIRKYGLEAVIRHDYSPDGPCHPEVFFPRNIGTGPVYVQHGPRQFSRSCGEGKGPNSVPDYLENRIALELIKDDPKYCVIRDYYVPVDDLTLPVYEEWFGKMNFNSVEEKRRFIHNIRRKDSGC